MSGKPVKPPATKNWPAAVGFVTQALEIGLGDYHKSFINVINHYLYSDSPSMR
jgi:hypothetical protein